MPFRNSPIALIVLVIMTTTVTWTAADIPDEISDFWSFRVPADPPPPSVQQSDWPISPIDRFVLAKLEAAGLHPAAPADKRTLIRRATFDLTGLPPTVAEIDAFLGDEAPDAFARLVDRLLASPRYGERWGRHWLDVARYADSNGMDENLAYANAFRYRDWVIEACNSDKPYDAFVREQIAGDLPPYLDCGGLTPLWFLDCGGLTPLWLSYRKPMESGSKPPHSKDGIIATGFLSLGPKMLAEDDPVKMEMDIIDEQLDTIGRTFMGLTLGCARCHDHKFDPLSMADYYGLAGILKSTKTMDNFKVVARWHERPIGSADAITAQEASERAIAAAKADLNRITTEANDSLVRDARRNIGKYLIAASALCADRAATNELRSRLADPAADPSAAFVIEAEQFARGNVKRDNETYGTGIGVIYNQGELPNFAEFDVAVPDAATYQIELRYAAAESRPVRLSINGKLIRSDAAGQVTGTWYPDTQTWFAVAVLRLSAGMNTIRLERDQPFPHFDKIALVRRDGAKERVPRTSEGIARDASLNVAFLDQWAAYLDKTRSDASSPLAAWHATVALAKPTRGDALFDDLYQSMERSLATRYQQLCDEADSAWQALRSSDSGKSAKELPDAAQESLRHLLYDPKGPFAVPSSPERFYVEETAARWKTLRDQLAELERAFMPLPDAMAVRDGQPQNLRVHLRGSHLTLGDEVARRFPGVLASGRDPAIPAGGSGRRELAEWLTRPEHPLTSRVMVNRLWHWHFGAGLVRTTDNFGKLGERPSHPELLDWLACRFVESGWSLKAMHRTIMLSATYQMSTAYDFQAAQLDPENRLMWRASRRRLEAEAIRDAILAVSGELDQAMGGSLLDGANRTYVKGYPNSTYDKYDFKRRSVYLPVLRSMVYDVFQAFDFPDPSSPNGERATTTVAPQALFMLNGKLVSDQSRKLAERLLNESALDDSERIRQLYDGALGRPASRAELARALDFIERYQRAVGTDAGDAADCRILAWRSLCRSVLASSEFVTIE